MLFMLMIGSAKAQTSTEDITKDWERAKAYTKEYLVQCRKNHFH